jgi:hypothetical protein
VASRFANVVGRFKFGEELTHWLKPSGSFILKTLTNAFLGRNLV